MVRLGSDAPHLRLMLLLLLLHHAAAGAAAPAPLQRGTYLFGGFECAYRRKPAAPGFEGKPPVLLIHPLGIGLSSWFFDPFLEQWNGSEVWVPDLIGCGASEAWVPDQRTLAVPEDYVRSLQALWRDEIRRPMVALSQGGLAPLAIRLAAQESSTFQGSRAVRGLVLASPPEWQTITDGLSEAEVQRNFERLGATLGSPSALGTLGYRALCARPFVRFFSDQFLFAEAADARFVDACCEFARPSRRWPVLAFNAGLMGQRGLGDELRRLRQPTLVLAGETAGKPLSDDGRGYEQAMQNAQVRKLAGRNVLPWESTSATCEAVLSFVDSVSGAGLRWGGGVA